MKSPLLPIAALLASHAAFAIDRITPPTSGISPEITLSDMKIQFRTRMPISALPELFHRKEFNAETLAKTVNYFVLAGEEESIRQLTDLATDPKVTKSISGEVNSSMIAHRIGWVCRILFQSKEDKPLPAPKFGALIMLPDVTATWPLYPLVQSGDTYFVLSESYLAAGAPENPAQYVQECSRLGVFRKNLIHVPTRAEAMRDAEALTKSPEWVAVKEPKDIKLLEWILPYIRNQAESIP